MEAYKDAILAFAVFFPAVELFSTTAIAVVFWYGGLLSFAGAVKVGVLVTFMQFAQPLLPAHPGPERKIQYSAIRHGGVANEFSNYSTSRSRLRPPKLPCRSPLLAAKSNSGRCGLHTPAAQIRARKTGCCAMSPSASRQAKRWPSSATPAPEKPHLSSSCCAFTKFSEVNPSRWR